MTDKTSALYQALFNIQSLNLKAKKDTEAYNYKYADLEEVWSVLSKPLKDNKLVVMQMPMEDALRTVVAHAETGETFASDVSLRTPETSKNHMQDLGAAITYARRYALTSMFNIITNDDDNASNTTDKPAKPVASSTKVPSAQQIKLARDLLGQAKFSEEAIEKRLAELKTSSEASELIKKLIDAGHK